MFSRCTRSENQLHGYRTGLITPHGNSNRGAENGRAKLTEEQVKEIREKYTPYIYSARKLGEEYGVSKSSIDNIINNKTWN
jgi:hypothetical protein